jgi:carnitine 3-dehydrogenase
VPAGPHCLPIPGTRSPFWIRTLKRQRVSRRLSTVEPKSGGTCHYAEHPEALACVDFVQECLPEDLTLKQQALAQVEPILNPWAIIASSTSGLSPTAIADALLDPGRLVVGHPCNPPYLMPVVELVRGDLSSDAAVEKALAVYRSAGRSVIQARRSVPGHIVNRLQSALWREMLHLWRSGVCDLDDLDRAVTEGLAPRWCLIGPTDVFQVSGGSAGMAGFAQALGPQMDRWWSDLGAPQFDEALASALIAARQNTSSEALTRRRDDGLPRLLQCSTQAANTSPKPEEIP